MTNKQFSKFHVGYNMSVIVMFLTLPFSIPYMRYQEFKLRRCAFNSQKEMNTYTRRQILKHAYKMSDKFFEDAVKHWRDKETPESKLLLAVIAGARKGREDCIGVLKKCGVERD